MLVIHLNRFRYSQFNREKISTDVIFPITGLNIAPFLQSDNQESIIESRVNNDALEVQLSEDEDPTSSLPSSPIRSKVQTTVGNASPVYDLAGVSHHNGSMHGGHYIAHINVHSDKHDDGSNWMCFNDARVSNIPPTSISGPSAYVLFYYLRDSNSVENNDV